MGIARHSMAIDRIFIRIISHWNAIFSIVICLDFLYLCAVYPANLGLIWDLPNMILRTSLPHFRHLTCLLFPCTSSETHWDGHRVDNFFCPQLNC